MAKKPPPKPPAPNAPRPSGLISQTGNRPGGTVTGSYITINEGRNSIHKGRDSGKKS
jgi:hypothetical protein